MPIIRNGVGIQLRSYLQTEHNSAMAETKIAAIDEKYRNQFSDVVKQNILAIDKKKKEKKKPCIITIWNYMSVCECRQLADKCTHRNMYSVCGDCVAKQKKYENTIVFARSNRRLRSERKVSPTWDCALDDNSELSSNTFSYWILVTILSIALFQVKQ